MTARVNTMMPQEGILVKKNVLFILFSFRTYVVNMYNK